MAKSFTIEENTPIPAAPSAGQKGAPKKYPWTDLKPGQCIVLDDPKEYRNATQSAQNYKKQDPTFDYVGRRCSDGYFRVWRTVPNAEKAADPEQAAEPQRSFGFQQ